MTVYVDNARHRYGRMLMCHMVADTDEELHHMADLIGVSRRWWQSPGKTSGSHYDICLEKRRTALHYGAQPVTLRQMAAMNMRRRITGELGAPEDAEAWLSAYFKQRRAQASNAIPSEAECALSDE